MRETNPYRRPALAGGIASLLMILSGAAYRTVATQMEPTRAEMRSTFDALDALPMSFSDWMGEDIPLDDTIVQKTGTDALINRRYSRILESVSLYVGDGTRAREMMQHRPEACYIAAGWTRVDRSVVELTLGTGAVLPCVLLELSRGALSAERITVVHYYVIDGHYCQSLSEWRYRFWRVRNVAQVQIVASVMEGLSADEARRSVCAFAVDSAPLIAGQLQRVEKRQSNGPTGDVPERRGR